jgi:hypothetical protein
MSRDAATLRRSLPSGLCHERHCSSCQMNGWVAQVDRLQWFVRIFHKTQQNAQQVGNRFWTPLFSNTSTIDAFKNRVVGSAEVCSKFVDRARLETWGRRVGPSGGRASPNGPVLQGVHPMSGVSVRCQQRPGQVQQAFFAQKHSLLPAWM